MSIWLPDLAGRDGPKYLQIVEAMAADITSGRLAAGSRVPPHRELAYRLGLSANTTSRAYAEAVKRALLRGEVGRGTFVRGPAPEPTTDRQADLQRAGAGPIDLSRNLPLPGFADPHIRRILADLGAGGGLGALLDYQTDADLAHFSEAGSLWLADCGLTPEPDRILATMGGQHGLFCTLTALLAPGDLLLTEALTYMPVHAMADRLGLHLATVAMDAEGVVPEAFEALCRQSKPKALYLTPTLQAPTTVTLSDARRQAIAALAERHQVYLVEDDVFGPLKRHRPVPLASLADERTVYVTSLSKTVAPGLRVGFLQAPAHLVPALRHAINLSIWMAPPLTLEVAARLIREGTAGALTAQQRQAARHRQALARNLFGRAASLGDPDGFHLWLLLPQGWKADLFREACARSGVLVSEARRFAARPGDAPEAVRICLSHEAEEARVELGLRKVASLLRAPPNAFAMDI